MNDWFIIHVLFSPWLDSFSHKKRTRDVNPILWRSREYELSFYVR